MDLNQQQVEAILQGIKIPPQPQILVDIQMEQFQPEPSLDRIADLISRDVGLAGTILKTVNSPVFNLTNRITSIKQAVMLLGLTTVINIINGISIKGELSDDKIVLMNRFWDTAMDIAMVCSSIAKKIGFTRADEAYILGLFHNCGIPLMFARFPDYFTTLEMAYGTPTNEEKSLIIDVENELYQTNHAVIGYYTAKSWKLPKDICDAIADHHNIDYLFANDYSGDSEKKTLLSILKLSEHICGNCLTLGGETEDYEWEAIKNHVFEYTGLGEYDLETMILGFRDMGIEGL
jgi:HD-like signal output (HDOD) protein